MSTPMICAVTGNAICSQAWASGAMPLDKLDGQTIAHFGQRLAPANLSARQAREMGLLTSGICGPRSSTSRRIFDRSASLANRLRERTAMLGSTLFRLTWKVQTTPSGQSLFALVAPLCSGGFGGPDRRHRNYWVADRARIGRGEERQDGGRVGTGDSSQGRTARPDPSRPFVGLADAHGGQRDRLSEHDGHERHGAPGRWVQGDGELAGHSHAGGLGHTHEARHQGVAHRGGAVSGSEWPAAERAGGQFAGRVADADGGEPWQTGRLQHGGARGPGPLNGFWANADWLLCRDERWRPVEPGTFPLDTGIAARLWRLRAFGDAINAQVAREFLEAIDYVDAAT